MLSVRLKALEDRTAPAVYNVTTAADAVDPNDGVLSLREAVLAANASAGVADTINLPAGNYVLTLTGANEDAAATGDLDVLGDLTISGVGAAGTFIDGNRADRVFDLRSGALALSGLTVRNGLVIGGTSAVQGGGILSAGTLTLTDCAVTGNQVRGDPATAPGGTVTGTSARGGGIYQAKQALTLLRTTVSDNQVFGGAATGDSAFGGSALGGGVYGDGGTLTVTSCLVTRNLAQGGTTATVARTNSGAANGGGIYQVFAQGVPGVNGTLTLESTTVDGNRAVGGPGSGPEGGSGGSVQGGGVCALVPAAFTGCAVVNNQAIGGTDQISPGGTGTGGAGGGTARGGGVYAAEAFTLVNSTVSGNVAKAGNGVGAPNHDGIGGYAFGGGLEGADAGLLSNCTLTGNAALGGAGSTRPHDGFGGGIRSSSARLVLRSTILAGNSAAVSPDIDRLATAVPVTSLGNNLIGLSSGLPGLVDGINGDQVGTTTPLDPRLAPLADNGGPTPTHALLPDSPAIDRGANAPGLAADQRGPNWPRAFGPPDVGAFEQTQPGIPTASAALADVTVPGGSAYQFTVTFADDTGIVPASIFNGTVTVTGPNGFDTTPAFVGLDGTTIAPTRTATFRFTPPSGAWGGAGAGLYTVSVAAGRVMDVSGNFVPAGPVGVFLVDLPSTYRVTNTNDAGPGSLRQAVLDANLTAAADTVVFDAAVFAVPQTITLTSGTVNVGAPLTVTGPGTARLTVSGNSATRVFYFDGPGRMAATLSGLTISAGQSPGGGGAVTVTDEALTVDGCAFTNNKADGMGGAIFTLSGAAVVIRNSSFTGNVAAGNGGAIHLTGGSSLVLEGSTLAGNSAQSGGALYVSFSTTSPAPLSVANCTFSGNTAAQNGGAVMVLGSSSTSLTVRSTTVTGNRATAGTGGGLNMSGTSPAKLLAASCIVSGNTATTAPDVASAGVVDLTFSAVGSAAGFTLSAASGNNLPIGTDLKLGPLADNGGPTRTHALLPGSPAINAGSNPAGLTFDQRGFNYARVQGAAADIGAFEMQPPRVLTVAVNGGAVQRSRVTDVTVTFDAPVTLPAAPAAAFRLSRTGPGGPTGDVTLAVDLSGSTAMRTVARLTFSGPLTESGSLIDGQYTLTIFGGQITGPGGLSVDGDGDGTPGGDGVASLYRLYGDVTGDRFVNGADFALFRTAFGTNTGDPNYNAAFDVNGDGFVNGADFAAFRTNFGLSI